MKANKFSEQTEQWINIEQTIVVHENVWNDLNDYI